MAKTPGATDYVTSVACIVSSLQCGCDAGGITVLILQSRKLRSKCLSQSFFNLNPLSLLG